MLVPFKNVWVGYRAMKRGLLGNDLDSPLIAALAVIGLKLVLVHSA